MFLLSLTSCSELSNVIRLNVSSKLDPKRDKQSKVIRRNVSSLLEIMYYQLGKVWPFLASST